ncbi:MAG TPA: hypothetical protein DDZ51_23055 [Planctomycetaceae bacterium]|nr:hypothetical protein [Planctomycetaceae bacterium]
MKKFLLAAFALMAAPVVASEPAELRGLGLDSMQVVSENEGMQVRGLSSSSAAMSVNSLAGLFYDPATGSQTNFEAASFNSSSSAQTVNTANSSGAEAAIGATALSLEVGTFSASMSQFALFAGGQSANQGAFTFSLNVPSFK